MPIDSGVDAKGPKTSEAVDLGSLLSSMSAAGNRINIAVIEASRSYPRPPGALPSSVVGLAPVKLPKGLFIASSSRPGTVVTNARTTARGSLYTKMLLKSIAIPGRTLPEVFNTAQALVVNTTQGQRPWFSSSTSEDFIFLSAEQELGQDPLLAMSADEGSSSRKWLWLLLGLGVAGSMVVANSDAGAPPSTGGVEIEVVLP